MSFASLIFEGLVACLLVGAVVMCWRVDRRLKALRDGQDGLKNTIGALNDAVDRARASLAALDRASKNSGEELQVKILEARRLSDELRLLTDRGEVHASRATGGDRRSAVRPQSTKSDQESRLLDALKSLR